MIRNCKFAGTWYKDTQQGLERQLRVLFLDTKFGPGIDPHKTPSPKANTGNFIGIISPHASLQASGVVAANSYIELFRKNREMDSVIILGPNHVGIGNSVSIYPRGSWKTPLGDLQIDQEITEFAQEYQFSQKKQVSFDIESQESEHSIEIQLPFLKYLYADNLQIVPICIAKQTPDISEMLAVFIYDLIDKFSNKRISVIASSDLSHESNNYSKLLQNDEIAINSIKSGDAAKFESERVQNQITTCGYAPVQTIMKLASKLGKPIIEKLQYANSKQILGRDDSYVVGYPSLSVSYA